MKSLLLFTTLFIVVFAQAQEELPYRQIPEYPSKFTPGSMVARMIDGLGYRYYWATEGLREEDLTYKPNNDGRTTSETLDHIYGLSKTIVNVLTSTPNLRGNVKQEELSFVENRRRTLENFKKASELAIGATAEDLESYKVIFKGEDYLNEYPFWNVINGQIADAIWHTGQIVLLRRSSGNPLPAGVNVFTGVTK